MQLTEQYRPRSWEAVVGQDKVVSRLAALRRRGLGGRAYLLSGKSGTGKTTIARLIAAEIAHPLAVEELDPSALDRAKLRDIELGLQSRTVLQPAGRAWIINECHGLRAAQVRDLLTLLEPEGGIPDWATVIFTTTADGLDTLDGIDAAPFLSRCLRLPLSERGLCEAFAARAREIAQAEGLDGQPIEKYVRLVKENRNNLRAVLSAIEAGEMIQ